MNKKGILASVVAIILIASVSAFAADVSGVIKDASGKPVTGIKVIAQTSKQATAQIAVSGANGEYTLASIQSADYRFSIDPGNAGFKKGEPVAAFVPEKGLRLNWIVSASSAPIAYAEPDSTVQVAGVDPFGLSLGEFIAASVVAAAGAGGIAVGAYAGAGGFSGGKNTASASK